ncbi:MAG TPA: hypothetical protein VLM79_34625 [Kofleriaceae bacterium]|nr:hypothetical protein [Kofleriaceae bacterium]
MTSTESPTASSSGGSNGRLVRPQSPEVNGCSCAMPGPAHIIVGTLGMRSPS